MIARSMIARFVAAAAVAATLAVPSAGTANTTCDGPSTFARFLSPKNGQFTVQTQAGTTTLTTGSNQPVIVSTTGTVAVEIEHKCLTGVSITVSKNQPGAGPAVVHTHSWSDLSCDYGTLKHNVPIGLDGGEYTMQLDGTSCNGKPVRGDGQGGVIGDPPLPL